MAFKFGLQKLLDYREQLEEEAKVRFSRAQMALEKSEQKLAELKGLFQDALARSSGQLLSSAERWLHDQYIKGLRTDIENLMMQVQLERQLVEEARKYLTERAIDKKLLDKLKERKKQQFNREEQKQEQIFNDEIATIRHKTPAVEAG